MAKQNRKTRIRTRMRNKKYLTAKTHAGDLDLTLAQRLHAPSGFGAPSTSSPTTAISASLPHPPPRSVTKTGPTADGDGGRCGGGEAKVTWKGYKRGENGRTAMERAWEAFKAHRDDASIPATMRAAAAAATAVAKSIAFEHVMRRSRRMLTEKGSGPGKRLCGPVQITLEDLQVRSCRCRFPRALCVVLLVKVWSS